jgi:hypothetical protein
MSRSIASRESKGRGVSLFASCQREFPDVDARTLATTPEDGRLSADTY